MLRETLMALALTSLVGCSASFQPIGSSSPSQDETAQLAAYAATARLPDNVDVHHDMKVAAVVDRGSNSIHIYNFSDQPVESGNIWINREFVQRVDSIPAHGQIVLSRAKFFDRNGQSLTTASVSTETIHLQHDNDVYELLGPAYQ
jgi:hypothetical protein